MTHALPVKDTRRGIPCVKIVLVLWASLSTLFEILSCSRSLTQLHNNPSQHSVPNLRLLVSIVFNEKSIKAYRKFPCGFHTNLAVQSIHLSVQNIWAVPCMVRETITEENQIIWLYVLLVSHLCRMKIHLGNFCIQGFIPHNWDTRKMSIQEFGCLLIQMQNVNSQARWAQVF
jgi:hypothetical protein